MSAFIFGVIVGWITAGGFALTVMRLQTGRWRQAPREEGR